MATNIPPYNFDIKGNNGTNEQKIENVQEVDKETLQDEENSDNTNENVHTCKDSTPQIKTMSDRHNSTSEKDEQIIKRPNEETTAKGLDDRAEIARDEYKELNKHEEISIAPHAMSDSKIKVNQHTLEICKDTLEGKSGNRLIKSNQDLQEPGVEPLNLYIDQIDSDDSECGNMSHGNEKVIYRRNKQINELSETGTVEYNRSAVDETRKSSDNTTPTENTTESYQDEANKLDKQQKDKMQVNECPDLVMNEQQFGEHGKDEEEKEHTCDIIEKMKEENCLSGEENNETARPERKASALNRGSENPTKPKKSPIPVYGVRQLTHSFTENYVKCNTCLEKSGKVCKGSFLCYTCESYLCSDCSDDHNLHHLINENCTDKEMDMRVLNVIDNMMLETDRDKQIEKESIRVQDRVCIKDSQDKHECDITGFSVIDNKSWLICDYKNCTVKRIDSGNTKLQFCIELRTNPYDVTTVGTRTRGKDETDTDIYRCFITLPYMHFLLYVILEGDVRMYGRIEVNRSCWAIENLGCLLFAVFREDPAMFVSNHSVLLLTTSGVKLREIRTGIGDYILPRMAVFSSWICVNDYHDMKLKLVDRFGWSYEKRMMVTIFKGLYGITGDKINKIYGCSMEEGLLYQVRHDLSEHRRLLNDAKMEETSGLHWHNDKLYVFHTDKAPTLKNTITVISIL